MTVSPTELPTIWNPSVLNRELKNIYEILPQSSTGTPMEWYPSVFYKELQTITKFYHYHRRLYRRTSTRRYLTESCKKIKAPAIITDGYTNGFTNGWSNPEAHACQSAWSVGTFIDGFANGRGKTKALVLRHAVTDGFFDGSKSLVGFLNFLV